MFGYVVMNKPEIKFKDFDLYRSFYCGLCRELRDRYGVTGQISLTYDMTFVILLLSGLYERRQGRERRDASSTLYGNSRSAKMRSQKYAADMNVFLAYYKIVRMTGKNEKKASESFVREPPSGQREACRRAVA